MPYNTRRKSLSLPSLGIQLPNSNRTHRSNSKSSSPDQAQDNSPPSKRVKREHDSPQPLPSPRRSPSADLKTTSPQKRVIAHTPPPSPGDVTSYKKIDLEGIKDDVVISVIEQLERTGNRPHLIKELATVLLSTNQAIANSANPAALLMSRLTQYMKRPWTALSPCPIAKELIPVHPRKVFFYLTSQPRGPLPDNSDDIIAPVIVDIKRLTPSITDPSINEDIEMDHIDRSRFSPSPEVELFSPELEHAAPLPPTPASQFGTHNIHTNITHDVRSARPSLRAPSPGLEADERGFTETATAVRANKIGHLSQLEITAPVVIEEPKQPRSDHDVGVELFGRTPGGLSVGDHNRHMMSSPMITPKHHLTIQIQDIDMDMDAAAWDVDIKSPEAVSFEEVEEMFDNF